MLCLKDINNDKKGWCQRLDVLTLVLNSVSFSTNSFVDDDLKALITESMIEVEP